MNLQDRCLAPRAFYDDAYRTPNYFSHRASLYRPYIRSLIAYTGLKPGAEVLDAGCGQGFFAHLFASEGMSVYGTDISLVGLAVAKACYGRRAGRLFVSDLARAATTHQFDSIFVRSCSFYNAACVDHCAIATERLLELLKPQGVFMFTYDTNLSGVSGSWRHHTLQDLRRFLACCCPGADLFFINKVDTVLLKRRAFNPVVTSFNSVLAVLTGLGGEAVAVYRKRS